MYEKPQYLTPDGYKRLARNPCRSGRNASLKSGIELDKNKKKEARVRPQPSAKVRRSAGKITLSEEGAKAIAQAIAGMMKNR